MNLEHRFGGAFLLLRICAKAPWWAGNIFPSP